MKAPGRKRVSTSRGKSRITGGKAGNAMLDLYAVKTQIDAMMVDERAVQQSFQDKLVRALEEFQRWEADWEQLARKIAQSKTSWLLPGLVESMTQRYERPSRPERISIAATDGSQIFPDRHEVSSCFLINIGYILLHYGTGDRPLMNSRPTVYYRDEDIFEEWGGRRMFVNRDLVGFKRGLMEFTELAELALAAQTEGYRVMALSDGTLILWNLEGKPQDFREAYLEATLDALGRLRAAGIPVAGYISQPGSAELVNALKLGMCPLAAADCDRCPWKADNRFAPDDEDQVLQSDLWQGPGLPCAGIEGLNDGVLLRQVLLPGERTPVFRSASKILGEYGDHCIHYFYVNVGAEIGRVEVPQWVAKERELLDLVHACVCDQAEKGQGYPVALSEAHERAVVRGADREAFYRFLRDSFVKNDIRAQVSNKSMTKRHAGI